jgi:hypothetical protein
MVVCGIMPHIKKKNRSLNGERGKPKIGPSYGVKPK